MSTIAERLARVGMWGATPESYVQNFLPCVTYPNLIAVKTAKPEDIVDTGRFWAAAGCSVPAQKAWGKHTPGSDTNDEGCSGWMGKALALQRLHKLPDGHGVPFAMESWVNRIIRLQLTRGGWVEWFGPVRPELVNYEHALTRGRACNDNGLTAILEGLASAAAVYELVGHNTELIKSTIALAISAHIDDNSRNFGNPLYTDPEHFCPLPCRLHEGPWVSPEATAMLAWCCVIAWAVLQGPYLRFAQMLELNVRAMRSGEHWYPFVRRIPKVVGGEIAWSWAPCGYDATRRAVHASQALWPSPENASEYVMGIPPSTMVGPQVARIQQAIEAVKP